MMPSGVVMMSSGEKPHSFTRRFVISCWRRSSRREGDAMRTSSMSVLKRHFWPSSLLSSSYIFWKTASCHMVSAFAFISGETCGTAASAGMPKARRSAAAESFRRFMGNLLWVMVLRLCLCRADSLRKSAPELRDTVSRRLTCKQDEGNDGLTGAGRGKAPETSDEFNLRERR